MFFDIIAVDDDFLARPVRRREADVVERLHTAAKRTLDDPAVAKRIADTGSLVIGNTPQQFAQQIAAEFDVYRKVVAEQKLTL